MVRETDCLFPENWVIDYWLRPCLNPSDFYKIWFLAIAYKNWLLNILVGMFRYQFIKIINRPLLSSS
jgi:hypothetical protein